MKPRRPHPRDVFTSLFRREQFTTAQKALLFDAIMNGFVDGDRHNPHTVKSLVKRGYIRKIPSDNFNDYSLIEDKVFQEMFLL